MKRLDAIRGRADAFSARHTEHGTELGPSGPCVICADRAWAVRIAAVIYSKSHQLPCNGAPEHGPDSTCPSCAIFAVLDEEE